MVKIDHTQCSILNRQAKGQDIRLGAALRRVISVFASEDKPWFERHKAAMLELDPQTLPGRIVAAKDAVQLRLKDIEGDSDHHAERQLQAVRETDPEKLVRRVEELCGALDKRNRQNQLRSETPDRKSA